MVQEKDIERYREKKIVRNNTYSFSVPHIVSQSAEQCERDTDKSSKWGKEGEIQRERETERKRKEAVVHRSC